MSLHPSFSNSVFTHSFLKTLNDTHHCFTANYGHSQIAKAITLVGQPLIDSINFFDVKSFQRFLNDINKRKLAEKAAEAKAARALSNENNHSDEEGEGEEAQNEEEADEPEDEEENEDDDQETEANCAKMAGNTFHDTPFLCKLLADFESESRLTRIRGVHGAAQKSGGP